MSQNYKDYSFADHKEVYLKLEETFRKFGVHYYLIGANARDVQLYKAGTKPNRGTADIDFAVMLPDMETYLEIRKELKEKGFEDTDGGTPYRMYYSESNTVIDLLPYGEIAQKYTVTFPERSIELSVLGMDEVGQSSEEFEHPEGFTLPVSSLHGMVILKLIAWSEKPEKRSKDLKDIKALIDIAFENYEAELFCENSEFADLFDAEDFDICLTGARVLGRKISPVLAQNAELNKQLRAIVENELSSEVGPMAQQMVTELFSTVEELKKILEAINTGLNEGIIKD